MNAAFTTLVSLILFIAVFVAVSWLDNTYTGHGEASQRQVDTVAAQMAECPMLQAKVRAAVADHVLSRYECHDIGTEFRRLKYQTTFDRLVVICGAR